MNRRFSFQQYRTIDLILFAVMLVFSEAVIVTAARFWFPDQLYTVSVVAALTAIVMMRWGPWAAIHAVLGGAVFCFVSGATAGQFVIYCIGNLGSLAGLLLIRLWGKEAIREDVFRSLAFAIATQLCMQLGRGLVALAMGHELSRCVGFITTDAAISRELLQKALSEDIKDTYNMVSVDGDTSTNDTVLLLANGLAGNEEITEEGEDYEAFCQALHAVNVKLCRMIAGDGEGATALFEVKIIGAESKDQAVTLSKSVVTSNLVKTAIAGHDANWGRILCAMGYSGAQFDPEKVDLFFESAAGKIQIMKDGISAGYSEEEATKILSEAEVTAIADIKMGSFTATAWGCDLTHEYININADYRS